MDDWAVGRKVGSECDESGDPGLFLSVLSRTVPEQSVLVRIPNVPPELIPLRGQAQLGSLSDGVEQKLYYWLVNVKGRVAENDVHHETVGARDVSTFLTSMDFSYAVGVVYYRRGMADEDGSEKTTMDEDVHETEVGVHNVQVPAGSEVEVVEKGHVQKRAHVWNVTEPYLVPYVPLGLGQAVHRAQQPSER